MIDPVHWHDDPPVPGLVMGPMLVAISLSLFTPLARRHFEAMIVIALGRHQHRVATLYGMLDHGYQAAALGFALTLFGTTVFPVRSRYLLIASFAGDVVVGWGRRLGRNRAAGVAAGQPDRRPVRVLPRHDSRPILRERSARAAFLAQKELAQSRARIDDLLHSMLPRDIVARIQAGETAIADSHRRGQHHVRRPDRLHRPVAEGQPAQLVGDAATACSRPFDLEAERLRHRTDQDDRRRYMASAA
jgi:hypothetical protein